MFIYRICCGNQAGMLMMNGNHTFSLTTAANHLAGGSEAGLADFPLA